MKWDRQECTAGCIIEAHPAVQRKEKDMKREIMNLIQSESGSFRLNNISYLRRWTRDGLDSEVDKLTIEFDRINHVRFMDSFEVKARDYQGIINECKKYTQEFLNDMSDRLTSDMDAGYRNKVNYE